jgi:hypothetical protein
LSLTLLAGAETPFAARDKFAHEIAHLSYSRLPGLLQRQWLPKLTLFPLRDKIASRIQASWCCDFETAVATYECHYAPTGRTRGGEKLAEWEMKAR